MITRRTFDTSPRISLIISSICRRNSEQKQQQHVVPQWRIQSHPVLLHHGQHVVVVQREHAESDRTKFSRFSGGSPHPLYANSLCTIRTDLLLSSPSATTTTTTTDDYCNSKPSKQRRKSKRSGNIQFGGNMLGAASSSFPPSFSQRKFSVKTSTVSSAAAAKVPNKRSKIHQPP